MTGQSESNRQTAPLTTGRMPSRDDVEQLTRQDLYGMTPREIVDAKKAGKLHELLSTPAPPRKRADQ